LDLLTPLNLTPSDKLSSLVEHRSKFNLDFCELNVFETREQAEDFHLSFEGFTITSMLRGKKIMHLEGFDDFEYVPGETVLAPADTLMRIDFPEAEMDNPTQCTALVVDPHYLEQSLMRINESWKGSRLSMPQWSLDSQQLILKNNARFAGVSSKLLQVLSSSDPFKEYQADLILKELVLILMRQQHLGKTQAEAQQNSNAHALNAVMAYIQNNLQQDLKIEDLCRVAGMSKSSFYRAFADEFGLTPVQLLLEERLKHACQLLGEKELSVKEVAYASGFNDPNYFSRAFKKYKHCSPKEYRLQQYVQQHGGWA